jgi:hypothetical protein
MKALWRWLCAQPDRKWKPAWTLANVALFLPAWPASLLFGECLTRGGLLRVVGWTLLPVWGIYYLVVLGTFTHVTRLSDRIERLESELALLRSDQSECNP